MRRAEYCQGTGRLWVSGDRLLYVSIADHPLVEALERAAGGERPTRAVAAVVIAAGFDVPPFVFAEEGDTLQGIVCGEMQVRVDDGEGMVIDGAQGDPWSHLNIANNVSVTLADTTTDGRLWLDSGIVLAGGFRWLPVRARTVGHTPSGQTGSRAAPKRREAVPPAFTLSGDRSGPDTHGTATGSKDEIQEGQSVLPHRGSMADALDTELDTTVEAIRLAELRDEPIKSKPKRRPRRSSPAPLSENRDIAEVSASATEAARQAAPADRPLAVEGGSLSDIGPESAHVPLEVQHVQRRMVRSLVCLECGSPNPPSASHCRGCAALLSSASTDVREVPQPVLGVIHLSDGRLEMLNADLLIGRNPAYERLGPYQRAVVHAEHDHSVSRRHIELRLDGWRVVAINLADNPGTTVEDSHGVATTLVPGSLHKLVAGATIHYGDAWLRFEADQ